MKFQPTFIIDKYKNSSSKWILPIPVIDNGQWKLRCYMSRKKVGIFTDCYTYNIGENKEILFAFFAEKSYGQAYHKFIRLLQDRDGFINEYDHEKKIFTYDDIMQTMFVGKTAYVCEQINNYLNKYKKDSINLDAITIEESKTVAQLYREKEIQYD